MIYVQLSETLTVGLHYCQNCFLITDHWKALGTTVAM